MPRFSRFAARWWPTAVTLAAVLWLTLAPKPVPDMEMPMFPGADKIVHMLMMFGLTSVALFDIRRGEGRLGVRAVIVTALCVVVFSALDEWAQGVMGAGRSADILDFAADCLGIMMAAYLSPLIIGRIMRHCRRK